MTSSHDDRDREERQDFARRALEEQTGFMREFWLFLRDNKKWWLAPLIIDSCLGARG